MSEQPLEQGDPAEANYHYAEGVPGAGDIPEWFQADKYKTVEEQAKAYPEAQKLVGRLGKFVGAPEGDEGLSGYATENFIPEGVEVELDLENPLLKEMAPLFKEMGLSQEGMDQVAQRYTLIQKDLMEQAEKAAEFEIQQLGANGVQRIDNIKSFLTAQVTDEAQRAALIEMTTSAAAVQGLEALASAIRGQKMQTPPPAPALTRDEVMSLQMATDEHGNRKMRDPAYAEMVRQKWAQIEGDGPA